MLAKNRFITLAAMSVMALALIAATACGSDNRSPGGIEHVAEDADSKVAAANENDPTTIEPIDPGAVSQDMVIADDGNPDRDMIAVLDGAIAVGSKGIPDPTDGTRLADDELFIEGESRTGADPLDTDNVRDLPVLTDGPQRDPGNDDDVDVSDGLPLADESTINPDSCENVLPPAPEPFAIKTHSATDPAKADNPAVNTMCTAWYVSDSNDHSASVALIAMNSDEAATAHFELLQSEFSQGGIKFDEQRTENQDQLTATIDQGGIGAMVVVRIGSNLVSIHNNPTSDQKEWTLEWMLETAHDSLDRLDELQGRISFR